MAEKKVKRAKAVKRPRCQEPKCRKNAVDGSSHCADHAAPQGDGGVPKDVCKLSEIDLLKFIRTDNELHNHQLEIKNLEQAQMLEDREFEQRRAERRNRVRLLQQSIRQREVEQKQLLKDFGERYGFDATTASIDDQTGVVHEHPPKG